MIAASRHEKCYGTIGKSFQKWIHAMSVRCFAHPSFHHSSAIRQAPFAVLPARVAWRNASGRNKDTAPLIYNTPGRQPAERGRVMGPSVGLRFFQCTMGQMLEMTGLNGFCQLVRESDSRIDSKMNLDVIM